MMTVVVRTLAVLLAVTSATTAHAATATIELPLALPSTTAIPRREALRVRLVAAAEDATRTAPDRASRDLFTTMRDVFGRRPAPDRTRGLGAAVLRVGFVHQIDAFVREDARCAGVARLDAVHEGVARGFLGSALGLARGPVAPDCEDVAREAEVDATRGAVSALAMPARAHIADARYGLAHVWSSCGEAALSVPATVDPSLDDADPVLRRLQLARAALVRSGARLGTPCRSALDAVADASPLALARIADTGLGALRLSVLDDEIGATSFDCQNDPFVCGIHSVVGDVAVTLARGGATPAVLRVAIAALVARGAPPARTGLAHDAVRALHEAIVTPRAATIDPDLVLAALDRR